MPSLDLIINVESSEIHHVIEFLPSLDWDGGLIGLRLRLEPKNIEELRNDFVELCNENKRVMSENGQIAISNFWPNENIQEFLSRHLDKYFRIKSYVIDPYAENTEEILLETSEPLKGLIKINVIGEDAGFFNSNGAKNLLSSIIQSFYKSHFDNDDRKKTANDLVAIKAINDSKSAFDTTLTETFSEVLNEIRDLGYPGSKNDPNISISSKIDQIETLGHESAIRFKINNDGEEEIRIPEGLNGLGFRRLISITLTLIDFRETWLRKNKLDQEPIEPLHLVLIEEPEAHLHAQVQQVFIKKAYETLCLGQPSHCGTQLLVSTHSSYLARELDFSNLRYFKRKNSDAIPHAEVVDLSRTFDENSSQNEKFVTRYIRTTHCDLFFANGVILVEGDAERLLLPHFIKNHFPKLNKLTKITNHAKKFF
ncbi:ATP-dependent nuclease [Acinetobacter towneri]|uniref:ATP-dependent nuclease n=1 Tax=Acinetobacter towneri TaxID=202956 RepID=UPI002935599A|nr:AAA family ATPase [Acinetobacter towneri]MDV2485727.1 AAA family ATPase [Acinetobacter towneri]